MIRATFRFGAQKMESDNKENSSEEGTRSSQKEKMPFPGAKLVENAELPPKAQKGGEGKRFLLEKRAREDRKPICRGCARQSSGDDVGGEKDVACQGRGKAPGVGKKGSES